jgi:hypothetical protein
MCHIPHKNVENRRDGKKIRFALKIGGFRRFMTRDGHAARRFAAIGVITVDVSEQVPRRQRANDGPP